MLSHPIISSRFLFVHAIYLFSCYVYHEYILNIIDELLLKSSLNFHYIK